MCKFEELTKFDCSEKIEKRKDGSTELSYLSWAWAWSFFKKHYPEAQYSIKKFTNAKGEQVPYMYDDNTGYMVNTEITADSMTYEMWLPVMNSANKAMKNKPYTYSTKYNGEKTVEAASMFDVNKTIMRCLVKNMAMFGLGLYIYAGEDLPESENKEEPKIKKTKQTQEINADFDIIEEIKTKVDMPSLVKFYNDNKAKVKNAMEFTKEFQRKRNEIIQGKGETLC